jgi:hypothetical protein
VDCRERTAALKIMQAIEQANVTCKLSDSYRVALVDEATGYGLFATQALPKGTKLFEEYPMIGMQHGANKAEGVAACERCFRFLGPLEAQISGLLVGRNVDQSCLACVPTKLPHVEGMPILCVPCSCPGGCDLRFCSEACAQANFEEQHKLLCPRKKGDPAAGDEITTSSAATTSKRSRPVTEPASSARGPTARTAPLEDMVRDGMRLDDAGAAMVDVTDGAAGSSLAAAAAGAASSSAGADGEEEDGSGIESLPEEPLARFYAHCKATNEIFGLAGKAVARVLVQLQAVPAGDADAMKRTYEAAMAPFSQGVKWWDAVVTPDDVTDEAGFRRTLRALLTESWTLLAAVLGAHAPAGCPLFSSADAYSRIVGAFERRNCAIQVASPVEEYFLLVDALDEGAGKAAITAVTGPVLDALDASYALSLEGTGLFPLQATMNHHCEPNVTLLKEEAEEERDGRVVARLTRDVAAGEELCNSYVDVAQTYKRRQRELREYGFECRCTRCVREAAAAAEKKDKKAGKRKLK